MRMRHIVFCGVPGSTIFSILSHKRHQKKKVIGRKMCVSIFSTTFVWNIFHSRKNWTRYFKNVYWSTCKVSLILVLFQRNLNVLHRFFKYNHIKNFMDIRPVSRVVPYRHTDGRTDRQRGTTNLTLPFRNFANASKTEILNSRQTATVLCESSWIIIPVLLWILFIDHCLKYMR